MTKWKAGDEIRNPNCDITLDDGYTSVGLMLADRNGKRNPLAIKRTPYPRQSTKISQTNNKYSDLEPPYYSIMQDSWVGGRASLNFEDDTTRYMDNFRAWTDLDKQICNGPQETYCSNFSSSTVTYRDIFQAMPGDVVSGVTTRNNVEFVSLIDTSAYIAHKFTIGTSDVTTSRIAFIIKRVGTPTGWLHLEIYEDKSGEPGNPLIASVLQVSSVPDDISMVRELGIVQTLTNSTSYWVVIHQATGTATTDNHWEVGTNPDAATDTKVSASGSVWSAGTKELYFRVLDDKQYNFKYFEYKRSIYAVNLQDSTKPYIFMNGDRGVHTGTYVSDRVTDTTKSWTVNEWKNCIVLITKGAGASEKQPWRVISNNTATYLGVSTSWNTTLDATTEYVILGSNKWTYKTLITGLSIIDVAVANELVYFSCDGSYVRRYNESNISGVWTQSMTAESIIKANKLRAIYTPDGWELWGSNNASEVLGSEVFKAKVPSTYSTDGHLYNLISTIDDGKGVWDEQVVSNVTVSNHDWGMKVDIASGYMGAKTVCSKAITSTDITKGNKIGLMIMSSMAQHSGDIKLKYDDTPFLGRNYTPDNVWHYDHEILPTDVIKQKAFSRPTSVYYWDNTAADLKGWRSISNLFDGETTNIFQVTMAADDHIYISYPERFTGIYVDMGSTKNAVADSHLTAEFWDGDSWTSVSITADGTNVGAHPNDSTLGQSGYIYWTTPTDWNLGSDLDDADGQGTHLAADRYHLRLGVNKALTASVDISNITCQGDGDSEAPSTNQFVSLKNTYDNDYSSYYNTMTLYNKDALYVRYSKRFNRIEFDIDTLNNNASTMNGYYWDGESWVLLTHADNNWHDSTATGGATLAVHEDAVTFTMPGRWQAGCPSYLSSYLSATDYVIKLQIVTDATLVATPYLDSVTINKITLEDTSSEDVFNWEVMNNVKDGDTNTYDYLNLTTTDYVYVMFGSKFNKVYWTIPSSSNNNDIDSIMAAEYFNGHAWEFLTLTSDGTEASTGHTTLSKSGEMLFTIPYNWQPVAIGEETGYAVRFSPTNLSLTEGIKITELYVKNDDAPSLNVPALVAGRWEYAEMSISPNAVPNPDDSKIISIGLYVTHSGAQTIYIKNVDLISDALPRYYLSNSRINSIEAYGDERTNPWIFTEDMIYEIQTQNDNSIVPMPLREITAFRSEQNGIAHTVSNVYLMFNLGEYIQKYYQHNLDDVGPNRDEGLPSDRQGDPTCLLSYPGKIFLSINASTTGYSTVMIRSEGGWHEVYRAPYGAPIYDMIIQVIPSMSTRLWVSQESDILYLPLPTGTWNPKNDSNFKYTHESVITTGWINVGFMDISKFWKSVKLYTENLSGTSQYIKCQYQIEDGDLEHAADWIEIEDTFDTSPFQEILLDDGYDVTARRIRFRFKLITTSNSESPIIKSSVVDALLRFPTKYAYSCTIMLADRKENYFNKDNSFRVEMDTDQLEEWSNAPTVLTMRCNYTPYDNKKVVIEPLNSNPIAPFSTNEQLEKHLATITLLEV